MKVLLFGGSGYIGRHVAKHLAQVGHQVTAVLRTPSKSAELAEAGVELVAGDLLDEQQLAAFGRDHDAVVYIAQLMLEDEERVVRTLLKNLRDSGKAFIFTGGTSLLSERTDGEWSENTYTEEDGFIPRRQVAARLGIENMVRAFGTEGGVRAMCIRPPLIWGHGGSKVISDLFHSGRKTGAVCYVGRGLNVYSNVHVDDLAVLYGLALERGVAGALYHAVCGETNFRTMAEYVARTMNLPTRSVSVAEAAEIWDRFMGPIVYAGCSRTRAQRSRRELGWRPHPDRLDIRDDCSNPAYLAEGERELPAWVRA